MSTLKVNTIQSNTTSELDINSPLGTIPSLDVTGSATIGGNLNAVGVITAKNFTGNLNGNINSTGVSTFRTLTVQDNSSPEKLATIGASSVGVGTGLLVEVSTNSSGQIISFNSSGVAGGNAYGYGNGDVVTLDGPGSPTSKVRIGIAQVTPPNGLAAVLTSQSSLPAGSGYTPNQTNVLVSTTNITPRAYSLPAAKLPTTAFTPIPTTVLVGANSDQTLTNKIVIAGAGTSTGTESQTLQVTGGAYVSGNLGIGSTNPPDKLTVLGKIQVQQDSGSNSRIVLRGQPSSSYRWNLDNYSSSNTFRIYREDDATSASGAVAMSIDASTRNVTISGGNLVFDSGKGIDFSATANSSGTMTSELLNDYEEGTWTPTVVGTSSAGTVSYANRVGTYTKIGRQVFVQLFLSWSAGNGSGSLRISGLPFTASSDSGSYWAAYVSDSTIDLSTNNYIQARFDPGTSNIEIKQTPITGGSQSNVAYDAAAQVIISGCYYI